MTETIYYRGQPVGRVTLCDDNLLRFTSHHNDVCFAHLIGRGVESPDQIRQAIQFACESFTLSPAA